MERVIVERQFAQPITYEFYDTVRREGQWCLDQYRVDYHATYLSADGRRTVCLFDAPDAEALRSVSRTIGVPEGSAWTATFHWPEGTTLSHGGTACAGRPGLETVVVERRFEHPMTIAGIEAIPERGAWCLEAHRVCYLGSYFSRDRRRMLCFYEAPDAESVRLAQTRRNMPFERAWRATLHP